MDTESTTSKDSERNWAIWLIDCGWVGRRHDKLKAIWEALAEYWKERARVQIFKNYSSLWSHAHCLTQMWAFGARGPERFLTFTEFDFLPNFAEFFLEPKKKAALAAQYAWGVGGHPERRTYDYPAAWFMTFDTERVDEPPDFYPDGPMNDPGSLVDAELLPASFDYPTHCGATIQTGTHLFWQRHLHDCPMTIVGEEKMPLGEMQVKHDLAVEEWIKQAPEEFRRIFERIGYEPPGGAE